MFCLCMRKNANLLHTSVLCFFTVLLLSILYKQLPSQFQLLDRSRLPFGLFFGNLSKNQIICPKYLDARMISNRPFTTVPTVIDIQAKIILLYQRLSQHPIILDLREGFYVKNFRKILHFVVIKCKCSFAIDLSLLVVIQVSNCRDMLKVFVQSLCFLEKLK